MLPALAALKRALPFLTEARFAYLTQGYLKLHREGGDTVHRLAQLKLLLADWLTHLGFVSDQQQVQILDAFGTALKVYADSLGEALDKGGPLPAFALSLGDGRYVSLTGVRAWLDLIRDDVTVELPRPCATHVVCDVTESYVRLLGRLKGGKDVPAGVAGGQGPGPGQSRA